MCFSETNFPLISVLIIQFILHLPHFMWPWNVIMPKWCNIYFYAFLLFIPRKEFLFHKKTLEMKNDFLMSWSHNGPLQGRKKCTKVYTQSIAVNLFSSVVVVYQKWIFFSYLFYTMLSETVLIYLLSTHFNVHMRGWWYERGIFNHKYQNLPKVKHVSINRLNEIELVR